MWTSLLHLLLLRLLLLRVDAKPNILLLLPDQWRYDWDGRDNNIGQYEIIKDVTRLASAGKTDKTPNYLVDEQPAWQSTSDST